MKGRKLSLSATSRNVRFYMVENVDLTVSNLNFVTDGKVKKDSKKTKILGGKNTAIFTPNTKNIIFKKGECFQWHSKNQ